MTLDDILSVLSTFYNPEPLAKVVSETGYPQKSVEKAIQILLSLGFVGMVDGKYIIDQDLREIIVNQ